MKRFVGLLALVCAACGSTDLAENPPGRSVAGTLRYPNGQTLVDSYGLPGIAIFVQAFLADPETGAPTQQPASQPLAAYFKLLDDDEIAQARTPEGFDYQFQLINLGDFADAWPFIVLASLVDFDEFSTADAVSYFATSPFGAYPTACSLSVGFIQVPAQVRQQIVDAEFGGNAAAAEPLFAAVNARLPGVLAADQRIGVPVVIVSEAAPTTNISFDLYDAAQQPTTATPCNLATAEIINREIGISLARMDAGQAP